jgi:vitamin B12 transporter
VAEAVAPFTFLSALCVESTGSRAPDYVLRAPVVMAIGLWVSSGHAAEPASTETSALAVPAMEVLVHEDPLTPPVGPRDRSVAGSVVSRERLVGPGVQAQDVLRAEPGVVVGESGGFGAPAAAAVRGATAADTPVYLAGVRLNDDVGGTADLSLVPLWLIKRVEIYRGHVPVEADRLGPGGAIFFEPRRPTGPMGGVGYYGGSWGTLKGWVYGGTRVGRVTALLGVSADRANNRYPFLNDHGILLTPGHPTTELRQNADQRTLEGWGLGRVELGRGVSVNLLANGITREQGVPRLALLPSRQAREESARALGALTATVPLDSERRYVLESRSAMLIGRASYRDPLLELGLRTRTLEVTGKRVEQSLAATLDVTDAVRLRPVVNVAHERIEREPDDTPLGRAQRDFVRTAIKAQGTATEWLTLHALASAECHHTRHDAQSYCDVLAPAGRAGVELGGSQFQLLLDAGRYVRVPTLGELYGISGTVHGNSELTPESGLSVDLGTRTWKHLGRVLEGMYLDVFVFARWAEGLVAYTRTGQGFVTPYNVGRARVLGAEIQTGMVLAPALRADLSATLIDPRDTSPNRSIANHVLPYRSRLIAGPRLRGDWRTRHPKGLSGWGSELRALYQSSRYADPAGLGVIDQQWCVDLEVYLSWFNELLTARGRVTDVFDARRTDMIGYPLPGRSAYFGMEATW